MLDINFIRENKQTVAEAARNKGVTVDVDRLLELDEQRRELIQQTEALRQERNEVSAGMKGGKPSDELIQKGKRIKEELAHLEERLDGVEIEYRTLLKTVPNVPTDDTPVGDSEEANRVEKHVGEPPEFDFEPKDHQAIGEARGWIDKERAAKISGTRFTYLLGDLVQMQLALQQFTVQQLTDQTVIADVARNAGIDTADTPFKLALPPLMMRTESYEATGRLKADDVTYKLENDDAWLIGSAEHSLCAMYMDEILTHEELPVRYLGYSTSFRREAGTYGKDTQGIIRMHHFDKLEMESFTTPEKSYVEHELQIALQEHLMQQVGLPYQVVVKCTADMGGPNARGVDLETWFPAQGVYRETHSADYMTDYQTRGLNTRFRRDDDKIELLHTSDATAFAMGRTLAAIVENNQTADGAVTVPEVLRPFMGGKERI